MAIPYVIKSPYTVRAGARFTSEPGGVSLSVTRKTRLLPASFEPLSSKLCFPIRQSMSSARQLTHL